MKSSEPVSCRGADLALQRYLQEGLLAFYPCYAEGGRAKVYTLEGRHLEPRSVTRLVELAAAHYNLDLVSLRRRSALLLGRRHYLALALTGQLVLVPVTVRQALEPGETTQAFVSLGQVAHLLPPPSGAGPAAAGLKFKSGLELFTRHTSDMLEKRLNQGLTVQADCLRHRDRGHLFTGLESKALLGLLPRCSCFLKDFFLTFFRLEGGGGAGGGAGAPAEGVGGGGVGIGGGVEAVMGSGAVIGAGVGLWSGPARGQGMGQGMSPGAAGPEQIDRQGSRETGVGAQETGAGCPGEAAPPAPGQVQGPEPGPTPDPWFEP